MDGFSSGWGFSTGDMVANISGAGIFIAQEALWGEQRIKLKYNFLPSSYAQYRPDLLGESWIEQALKDYNGQAYWLTTNPNKWGLSDKWPRWLDLAFGYSASGMTGGFENQFPLLEQGTEEPSFDRVREYYLSLDIDLSEIPAKRNWFKVFRSFVGFIKIPAPAIGVNSNGKITDRDSLVF